jgi:gliding motility-associated lipoprotein GldH
MKWSSYFFLCLLAITVLTSCGDSGIYSEMRALEEGAWSQSDTVKFEFEVTDTVRYHQIKGLFRINSDYDYRNLYTKAILLGPNDMIIEAVNNHDITDLTGKFLGSGMGKLKNYELVVFDKLALKTPGKYTVQLLQFFRVQKLEGVQDVGLHVNTTNKIY